MTWNEDFLDSMIRHQVGILQFSGSVRNDLWALLDATEKDLKAIIRNATNAGLTSPAKVRALDRMLQKLRETRLEGWTAVRKEWFEDMRKFAVAEAGFFDRVLSASYSGVLLGATIPEATVLRNIVTSQPFEGKVLKDWAKDLQRADITRIEDAIKIGLVQGESPLQLSRRVTGTIALSGKDGVTQITRHQLATVIRTVVNGIGAESRRAYAILNGDLIEIELFVATLDSRTTFICRRFDGQTFKVEEGPRLPLHMGERSLRVAQLDGETIGDRPRRDFTNRQLLREFANREGIKITRTRDALPRGTKGAFDAFARARMRELTGTTAAKTTYVQWLRRQSAANQDDILGPTRGALFRRGSLTIDKFVETDGRVLTLSELAERNSSAFLRANLDPSDFL